MSRVPYPLTKLTSPAARRGMLSMARVCINQSIAGVVGMYHLMHVLIGEDEAKQEQVRATLDDILQRLLDLVPELDNMF